MAFDEECLELFGTKNLYEIFNLPTENTNKIKTAEIKKAYYKCSLVYHPDRAESHNKELATKKFQYLSKAYSILTDKDKRAIYDETGNIDDEDITDTDKDWLAYWRLLFKKITVQDIIKFEKKYKHSDEEKEDLKKFYLKFKGDMNKIMECVCCATLDDEERFSKILKELIDSGEIPDYPAFTKEPKRKKLARKRKAESEAKEAAEEMKKITGKSEMAEEDLEKMIVQRQSNRKKQMDSFLDDLAAKYGEQPKKKKSRR